MSTWAELAEGVRAVMSAQPVYMLAVMDRAADCLVAADSYVLADELRGERDALRYVATRVVMAFRALGEASKVTTSLLARQECERAMTALDAALSAERAP